MSAGENVGEFKFVGWPNEGVEYWNAHWRGKAAEGFFDGLEEPDALEEPT